MRKFKCVTSWRNEIGHNVLIIIITILLYITYFYQLHIYIYLYIIYIYKTRKQGIAFSKISLHRRAGSAYGMQHKRQKTEKKFQIRKYFYFLIGLQILPPHT